MLVAAGVCPHPPLLLPEIAAGAAAELDRLRAACDDVVARLLDARPERLVLVGTGARRAEHDPGAVADFRSYGGRTVLPLTGAGPAGSGDRLPLSLAVGAWLLHRAGAHAGDLTVTAYEVPDTATVEDCLALGRALAGRAPRVALLALGDGSARRSERAPGWLDPRAVPYDDAVTAALSAADLGAIARLDPATARDLLVTGRAPWQVLAGAAAARPDRGAGCTVAGRHAEAPYGVSYVVTFWEWQEGKRGDA